MGEIVSGRQLRVNYFSPTLTDSVDPAHLSRDHICKRLISGILQVEKENYTTAQEIIYRYEINNLISKYTPDNLEEVDQLISITKGYLNLDFSGIAAAFSQL